MSFKREGNDFMLLKNLQHRRVSELLGEHIPEDEASLLSNGRLTCTVCLQRPIFDTLAMLSVHRKGKKHLLELSKYLHHKRELEYRKIKQEQKNYLKNVKAIENITKLDEKDSMSKIISTPGSINRKKSQKFMYKRRTVLGLSEIVKAEIKIVEVSLQKSETAEVRKYLKSLCRKKPLVKTINKMKDNYGSSVSSFEQPKTSKTMEDDVKSRVVTEGELSEARYFLKMKELGYIKDKNGGWVKDPEVEFDSDDEVPQMN